MKSTPVVVASLLAAVAIAQPHRQHQAFHNKRDISPVVWTTEWDFVTETVGVTTTVWVTPGFVPPTPAAASPSASVSAVAAQFFEPAPSYITPSSSSSSSVYVPPPPPATTSVPPTSVAATTSAVVALVQSPRSSSPVFHPVSPTSVAPTTSTVVPVQSSTPAATVANIPTSGSTTGDCSSESDACEGDITHYDTGIGACGWPNVSTDKVIALPHAFMGSESNGNPFCGKTVTIALNGKTTTAEVVDKCEGCEGRSIDLSDGAFEDLADMSLGRVHNVVWWFN